MQSLTQEVAPVLRFIDIDLKTDSLLGVALSVQAGSIAAIEQSSALHEIAALWLEATGFEGDLDSKPSSLIRGLS